MIKAWREQFETELQKQEFDLFFKEFEKGYPKAEQPQVNLFIFNELIKLRSELKQIKRKVIYEE